MEAGVVEPAQRKERIECSVLVVEVEVVAGVAAMDLCN